MAPITRGSRSSKIARGIYLVSSDCETLVVCLKILGKTPSYLIEENILSVTALCRKVFEITILINAVLLTQLLPKLTADYSIRVSIHTSLIVVRQHPKGWDECCRADCTRTTVAALAGLNCNDLSIDMSAKYIA